MKEYIFYPSLILRTPILPLSLDISEDRIIQEFKKKEIEEAIFLSSPNLHSKIVRYLNTTDPEIDGSDDKLLTTLRKYLMRMRNRCTPFGLFASCAVVEWGDESRIDAEAGSQLRRTKLDMQFLCELIQHITSQVTYQDKLLYYPNNSIYKSFDRYRFIEYYLKDSVRYHKLSSVRCSDYLEALLDSSKDGLRLDDLAQTIVDEDIAFEEARAFVGQLVDAQLLVSELDANVTGTPVLERIISFLSKHENDQTSGLILILKTIKRSLVSLDSNVFNTIDSYSSIHDNIQKLGIQFEENRLIQTDSFRIMENSFLSDKIKPFLGNIGPLLLKLKEDSEENNIQKFRNAFVSKYEFEEKPLAEVLDTERGIGYLEGSGINVSTPLIEGIGSNFRDTLNISWTDRKILLFKIAHEAIISSALEVDLSDYEEEIEKLEASKDELPASMSAVFEVVENNGEQSKVHFKGIFGPSAVMLISRFADGHQPINKIVHDIAKHEETFFQNRGIELAEIAHLPESRTGNILFRPAFRKYEIPYLANSTLDKDHQLDISDLMISVKHNEIVLRSKKLNKRVLPRLGNAHAYEFQALPIYQFLADLQFQNIRNGFNFSWGMMGTEFVRLPRIVYKGVILERAEWNFTQKEVKKLRANPTVTLQEWKDKYLVPDLVVLTERDNELLINLNDPLSVNILLGESKKHNFLNLKEFLFSNDNALIKDEQGNVYTNEFIAFLLKKETENKSVSPQSFKSPNGFKLQRTFPPGSEWIYFKIYCGYKTSDKVISEYLLPFVEALEAEEKIAKWFFIRYNDPKPHIRFRVLLNDTRQIGELMCSINEVLEPLTKHGVVHTIQLDTYKRELERYGENLIEEAESFFCFDSKCVARFIDLIDGDEGEKYRWFFGMLSIDRLLDDFEIDLEKKIALLESLRKGFAEEFKINKPIKDQINQKYRSHRKEIDQLFTLGSELRSEMRPAIALLDRRSEEMTTCISIHEQVNGRQNFERYLESYIHMICNRLFISSQRKHELVIYDFLYKVYMSIKMKGIAKLKVKRIKVS